MRAAFVDDDVRTVMSPPVAVVNGARTSNGRMLLQAASTRAPGCVSGSHPVPRPKRLARPPIAPEHKKTNLVMDPTNQQPDSLFRLKREKKRMLR